MLFRSKQEVDGVTWSIESHAYSDEEPGICGRHSEAWPLSIDDARFIAHARQDIPRLLDAVRGLREAVSTHHDLDDDDLGRSCRSTCWVCRALAHVEALGEQE